MSITILSQRENVVSELVVNGRIITKPSYAPRTRYALDSKVLDNILRELKIKPSINHKGGYVSIYIEQDSPVLRQINALLTLMDASNYTPWRDEKLLITNHPQPAWRF